MKDKATSFDIAHMAGVSQSTVSRALNNSPLVNQETKDKIRAIAKELNYKVDKNASNLRKQRSATLALLLFEDPTADDSHINPFFLSMLGSITRACSQQGYDLLVSFQQLSHDWHADYEDTHKADGLILLGYGDYVDYQDKLNRLQQQQTHFVLWGAADKDSEHICISSDNFQGGYTVAEYLLSLERKKMAFIGGASSHCPEFLQRFNGLTQCLKDHGLTHAIPQLDAITTQQSGYDATVKLLAQNKDINAIACASDLIAIGVIHAIKDQGLQVPEDIAVVGYDDIPAADFVNPALTTVSQDTRRAGELLVQSLIKSINGEDVESQLIPAKLVTRKSCGH